MIESLPTRRQCPLWGARPKGGVLCDVCKKPSYHGMLLKNGQMECGPWAALEDKPPNPTAKE
jgi:hypothetical protein